MNDVKAEKLTCPSCASTHVKLNPKTGLLRCDFCRIEIKHEEKLTSNLTKSIDCIESLEGVHLSPGMGDIAQSENEAISFECPSCRAKMTTTVDSDNMSLKCHWCRHIVSTANKILNGTVPDGVIPFTITKEQAEDIIENYIKKKKLLACTKFIKTFSLNEILPVYLPYIVVDANASCYFQGDGAILKRVIPGSIRSRTTYDYEVYEMVRSFNMSVNDLLIEANTNYIINPGEKIKEHSKNIINFIQPYDTKQIVPFSGKFLNGEYRAEFRNVKLEDVYSKIKDRVKDVGMYRASETLKYYDHGVKLNTSEVEKIGESYSSILCPLWLYSYRDKRGKLHYSCVNGQTGKVAGSVPINKSKLLAASAVVQAVGIIIGLILWWL